MKICVAFYGFLGDLLNFNNLNRVYDFIGSQENEIDFYYSTPNHINEFDENYLSYDLINDLTKNINNFNFEIRDYNPCVYINECKQLNLPMITSTHNLFPYRNFSMLDSIKKSVDLITKKYDIILITRLDYLPLITTTKPIIEYNINKKIYLFRVEPRVFGVAEDRFIFGDFNLLSKVTNIYDYIKSLSFNDSEFYPENLIGKFFLENFKANLEFIDGVKIINNINSSKYSFQTRNTIEHLYRSC